MVVVLRYVFAHLRGKYTFTDIINLEYIYQFIIPFFSSDVKEIISDVYACRICGTMCRALLPKTGAAPFAGAVNEVLRAEIALALQIKVCYTEKGAVVIPDTRANTAGSAGPEV